MQGSWAPSFEPVISQIPPAPAIKCIELLKPTAGIYFTLMNLNFLGFVPSLPASGDI